MKPKKLSKKDRDRIWEIETKRALEHDLQGDAFRQFLAKIKKQLSSEGGKNA